MRIQEATVSLMTAERSARLEHRIQRFLANIVAHYFSGWSVDTWRLRHDLAPHETSQIVAIVGSHKAVGYVDIFPPVVVDVDKQRPPGPTA